jgi:hypothetical protein
MPLFRRLNCIVLASGIVTLRKQLFSEPVSITLVIYQESLHDARSIKCKILQIQLLGSVEACMNSDV